MNWVVHPRSRIRIFNPSRIPDSGVKKAPDPGSATLVVGPDPNWDRGSEYNLEFQIRNLDSNPRKPKWRPTKKKKREEISCFPE
jgi:hypothetical protein